MAVVAAGARNQRVTLEYRASEAEDSHGHKTPTWAVRGVEYAKEEQLSASESIAAAQLTGTRTTAWTIPFRDDLGVTDRMRVGTRTLQVTSITNPDGRRIETRIVCTERA